MKFLMDANVSYLVDLALKSSDAHDFIFIRDLNPSMKDDDIIELAEQQERIVITEDKDFGELVFKKQLKHEGVLLLRIDDLQLDEKIKTVEKILKEFGESLKGKFSV